LALEKTADTRPIFSSHYHYDWNDCCQYMKAA
jgi:hypothetical protein